MNKYIDNDIYGFNQIRLTFLNKIDIFIKLLKTNWISKEYTIGELLEDEK